MSSEVSVNPFSCLMKNVEASRSSLCQTHVRWKPTKMTVLAYLFFLRNEEGEVEEQSSLGRAEFGSQVSLLNSQWMFCLLEERALSISPHCLLPL